MAISIRTAEMALANRPVASSDAPRAPLPVVPSHPQATPGFVPLPLPHKSTQWHSTPPSARYSLYPAFNRARTLENSALKTTPQTSERTIPAQYLHQRAFSAMRGGVGGRSRVEVESGGVRSM